MNDLTLNRVKKTGLAQTTLSKTLQRQYNIDDEQLGSEKYSRVKQSNRILYFANPSKFPTPVNTNIKGLLGWMGDALKNFKTQPGPITAVMPIALETKFPFFKSLKHFCTLYIEKSSDGDYKIVVLDSKSSFLAKIKHFLMNLFGVNHLERHLKTMLKFRHDGNPRQKTTFQYHSYGAQGLDQLCGLYTLQAIDKIMESTTEIDIASSFPDQKAFLKSVTPDITLENFGQYCKDIDEINNRAAQSVDLLSTMDDDLEVLASDTGTNPSGTYDDKHTSSTKR